jgi:hypothetical protein
VISSQNRRFSRCRRTSSQHYLIGEHNLRCFKAMKIDFASKMDDDDALIVPSPPHTQSNQQIQLTVKRLRPNRSISCLIRVIFFLLPMAPKQFPAQFAPLIDK